MNSKDFQVHQQCQRDAQHSAEARRQAQAARQPGSAGLVQGLQNAALVQVGRRLAQWGTQLQAQNSAVRETRTHQA